MPRTFWTVYVIWPRVLSSSILKTPIPSEFMLMLPYVVTILAVAGFAGQIRGPAASGKPYIKE